MTHRLIHLPFKANKGGPFQYRWTFPFERKMRTLKGYVKNTARLEGCIAKISLDNECLNFCSMYLNDVETLFNKVERNNEMVDIDGDISFFSCKGRLLGSKITRDISNNELEKIHTYILHNCDEMVELIKVSDVRGLQVNKESAAQSSLKRGSNLLELVDGITFSSDSTGKASKTHLLIDEENIDDEETDPSDLESSKKEGSSQEDESSQEDYTDS
ncbi:DNA mismatch repair protein [Tanacetum coccineum]|uniref:DNA mismatch repair protein n=1 Tax=Tanacetum coccineum TaxID=301880 RepID=A0ABQ5G520_9ASTR